jgi:hypothetical protein
MIIRVIKNHQFPEGVLNLGDLSGLETILMNANLHQKIWMRGKSTNPDPIFGGFDIQSSQGPKGWGLEIRSAVGSPITLVKAEGVTVETDGSVFLYQMVPRPHGKKEWRPE